LSAIWKMLSWPLRIAAWLSVLGLLIASWMPGDYMVRTGVRGSSEHIGAYFLTTLLLVIAHPAWPSWRIGAALAAYAGGLELGQLYVPGRHSQFEDFAASCIGAALVIMPAMWMQRSAPVSTR
jgi:VanZ family protein